MVVTRSGKLSRKSDTVDEVEIPEVKRAKKATSKPAKKMSSEDNGGGPIYFWRETDGQWGYMSQWYHCPFQEDEGPSKTYKTAEQ